MVNLFVLNALMAWDHMGKRIAQADVLSIVCDILSEAGAISKSDPAVLSKGRRNE